MSELELNKKTLNIEYLQKGIYYDSLVNKETSEKQENKENSSDRTKLNKLFKYSNALNDLINDDKYIQKFNLC